MARQEKKTYDLSEAEQRDLFNLIQQGKALPEKYRFILFEDKREVELVWNGKTRDVCTTVLPFQTLEHIDEPRSETKVQEDLFDSTIKTDTWRVEDVLRTYGRPYEIARVSSYDGVVWSWRYRVLNNPRLLHIYMDPSGRVTRYHTGPDLMRDEWRDL